MEKINAKRIGIIFLACLGVFLSSFIPTYAVSVFTSGQVGSSAANGYVLQTNGTNSTWVATSSLFGIPFPIADGGTGTSTAPTYGKLLVGDANGNYEFTSTSTLGIPNYWTLSGSNLYNNSGTNVGIGTTSPKNTLQVSNPSGATGLLVGNGAIGSTLVGIETSAQAGGYGEIQAVSVSGEVYGALALDPSGGEVGIGTTTPNSTLDTVGGEVRVQGGAGFGNVLTTGTGLDFGYDTSGSEGLITALDNDASTYEKLRIAASPILLNPFGEGSVGIGTTSPDRTLTVYGTDHFNTGTNANIQFGTLGSGNPYISAYNDPLTAFTNLNLYGSNILLNPATAGDVGIGTSTPDEALDVNGNELLEGGVLLLGANNDSDGQLAYAGGNTYLDAGGDLHLRTITDGISVDRLVIQNSTGNVGIGTSTPLDPSSIGLTIGSATTGMTGVLDIDSAAAASSQVRFFQNGSLKDAIYTGGDTGDLTFYLTAVGPTMTLQHDTGNVGIGTTTPSQTLDVYSTGQYAAVFRGQGGQQGAVGLGAIGTGGFLQGATNDSLIAAATLSLNPSGGNVGVGTTTPGSLLSIAGIANFTTATSTIYSSGGFNLTGGGCYAINGTCIGGGGGSGTVTSISGSGGTTGLTLTGGPITTSGTLTLGGTLGIANGGTATTTGGVTNGLEFFNGTSLTNSANFVELANGNIGIGTTTPFGALSIATTSSAAFVISDAFNTIDALFSTASTTGSIFTVAATTSPSIGSPVKLFDVDQYGHLTASSTPATPTISTCGTGSPAMGTNANDDTGNFVTGTSASACTITFGRAYATTPTVVVSDSNTTAVVDVSAVSTTGFTVSMASALSAVTVYYIVVQP